VLCEGVGPGSKSMGARIFQKPQESPEYLSKPLGYSRFPKELARTPVHWVATTGNMVWSHDHGDVSVVTGKLGHPHLQSYCTGCEGGTFRRARSARGVLEGH